MTNVPESNAALKRRGDFTIWITEEAIAEWRPARTGVRSRPIAPNFDASDAYCAARDLVMKGLEQPGGYTEPLLHAWRLKVKAKAATK